MCFLDVVVVDEVLNQILLSTPLLLVIIHVVGMEGCTEIERDMERETSQEVRDLWREIIMRWRIIMRRFRTRTETRILEKRGWETRVMTRLLLLEGVRRKYNKKIKCEM